MIVGTDEQWCSISVCLTPISVNVCKVKGDKDDYSNDLFQQQRSPENDFFLD